MRFVGIGGNIDAKGVRQGIVGWNVVLCIRTRGVISFMPSIKEFCCVGRVLKVYLWSWVLFSTGYAYSRFRYINTLIMSFCPYDTARCMVNGT